MGRVELVGRIIADAEAKAARTVEEGRRVAAEIDERAQAEAARIRAETTARAEHEAELIVERARSRARLEMRQATLAARWRRIEHVLAEAAEQVRKDPRYTKQLEELKKKYRQTGASVEQPGDGSLGGLVVRQGRETTDLTIQQVLQQVREELTPDLARLLFAGGP